MRRTSVYRLVVLLPLVAALLFAARRAYVVRRQTEAMSIFNRSVSNGDSLPYSRLITDFGQSYARQHFAKAARSPLLDFDGQSRIAQICKDELEYLEGKLDRLHLHDFTDGFSTAVHQPPIGTKIKSVAFAGDGIDVSLYGELQIDGALISIPENSPETYHLQWVAGSPPSNPPLKQLIKARKRP